MTYLLNMHRRERIVKKELCSARKKTRRKSVSIELASEEHCTATKEISKYISFEKLIKWIEICENATDFFDQDTLDSHLRYFPKKELKALEKTLNTLGRKGWLLDFDINVIMELVKIQLLYSEEGRKYAYAYLLKDILKTGGRPIDFYLTVLMCGLVLHLKKHTGKPNYRLVADFIMEQVSVLKCSAETDGISEDAVKKNLIRFGKSFAKRKKIVKALDEINRFASKLTCPKMPSVPHQISPEAFSEFLCAACEIRTELAQKEELNPLLSFLNSL